MTQPRKKARRSDVILIAILIWGLLLGICIMLYAQSGPAGTYTAQDIINAKVDGRIEILDYRLNKVENVLYGLVALALTNVITHILDIKNRRNLRQH